ncbi:MAG: acetate--CoA ligase family protein [Betaproteobacteria bacterium]|nr:acetate--CoA ligase family protein [Betaproteobacteria bacterium]
MNSRPRQGDLSRLFSPRSIAIVGASENPRRIGGQPVVALTRYGYQGEVFLVNPRRPDIQGRTCYPDVTAIPRPCDVALIAVPAENVPEVLMQCGRAHIPFAIVLSAGFREVGNAELQARLEQAISGSGVRMLGPNCVGLLNLRERVFSGFGAGFRNPDLKRGPLAMVSQSGGFVEVHEMYDIVDYAYAFLQRRLPKGPAVGIITTSGGAGVLLADRCTELGLDLPPVRVSALEELKKLVPGFASLANPIDLSAQLAQDPERFNAATRAVISDPGIDQVILRSFPGTAVEEWARGLVNLVADNEKPVLISISGLRKSLGASAQLLEQAVAVKVDSPDIPHKTEAGAVRLNVDSMEELRSAAREVVDSALRFAPGATINGVLIQQMAQGLEVIVGALNDDYFGPVVVVGAGGVLTEVLGDRAMRFAPIDTATARELIEETRFSKLLDGYRGGPRLDAGALAELVSRLSQLIADHRDLIAEIDVNPVFVHAEGQGATAADALIILRR